MKTIASASAPGGRERARCRGDLCGVDGDAHCAVGERALVDLEAQVALDDRHEIAPQAPGRRPVAAAHLQHVAKAAAW